MTQFTCSSSSLKPSNSHEKHHGAVFLPDTHHMWRLVELATGLIGLEPPGDRGAFGDHLAGLEAAAQDPRGAVLDDHLGVGLNLQAARLFCDCRENIPLLGSARTRGGADRKQAPWGGHKNVTKEVQSERAAADGKRQEVLHSSRKSGSQHL